jgi:DNA-binding XRE family transcriptional regulator
MLQADNLALNFLGYAASTRQSFTVQPSFTEIKIPMGHSRPRPKQLAKKLLQIRLSLGISQGEMVKRLGVQALIHYTNISKYELNKNEPPLAILLAYARLAEIPVEQIIDDELELTI